MKAILLPLLATACLIIHAESLKLDDLPELINSGIPKFMRMPDDMNRMANYMGDLRIVTIVVTVTGYIGGICFVLLKWYTHSKKGSSRGSSRTGSRRRRYYDDVDQWELRSVRTDNDKKPLTPECEKSPRPDYYQKPPPPPAVVSTGRPAQNNLPHIDQ